MNSFFRYFIGVFLIGAGILLVLSNVGLIDLGVGAYWYYLYPVFIFIMGVKWLFDFFFRRGSHWFLGLFFTVFGSLLLLDRLEYITFYFKDIFKLWPLLIIYIGLQLFNFGFGRDTIIYRPGKHDTVSHEKNDKQYKKPQNFVVGSHDFSQPGWKVEPMNIRTMAGDFYLDFSKAYVPEGETPIHIRSLAGDVQILLPENIAFQFEAEVKTGSIEILGNGMDGINRTYHHRSEGYEEADRKLDFIIHLKAGEIRLDYV